MPTVLGLTNDPSPHASASATGGIASSGSASLTTSSNGHSSTSTATMGGGGRKSTISERNHAAALEVETLLWRAMCDSPAAAHDYLADDCVMLNPIFAAEAGHPDAGAIDSKSEPVNLERLLRAAKPWSSYRMHEGVRVVEIDLMAVVLLYSVTLFRSGDAQAAGGSKSRKKVQQVETVEATVSSCWRQVAGGDWKVVAQHVAYADDYEDEEE